MPPRRPTADRPLTPSEQVFLDEYLVDRNATRAYRAAYPKATYNTARFEGSKLLAKPHIRREAEAARRAQQQRTRVTADRVLRELARNAFSDVYDLFDADGRLRRARDIPIETRRAVAGVKVRKEKTARRKDGRTEVTETEAEVEYKFWPKNDALRALCDHLGLTNPQAAHDAFLAGLLAGLPADLGDQVRRALAGPVPPGGPAAGRDPAGG